MIDGWMVWSLCRTLSCCFLIAYTAAFSSFVEEKKANSGMSLIIWIIVLITFVKTFSSNVEEKKAKSGMALIIWIIVLETFVKTTYAEDSVDCYDLYNQPTFYDDFFKDHKIQEKPSEIPKSVGIKKNSIWKTLEAHVSTHRCPAKTVPVRNYDQSSTNSTVVSYPHEHAVVRSKSLPKMYGAKATISMWRPSVETSDEFSLAQVWITSGNYLENNLNSIEVGVHLCSELTVSPSLYQDNKPRLFIYWTSDTYKVTGCYNLQCPGFIQTSSNILLGGTITPVSTFEGNQYEITVSVWKDQKSGNWWLSVGSNHSLVGYWLAALFPNLTYANEVEWGGEIVNSQIFGRHTATQMGSGHFPAEGFGKSSYIRNLEIVDNNKFLPVQDVTVKATNPKFCEIKDMYRDDWGTYIFFGGPGMHSGVSSLAFSSLSFYFGFIILFII